MSVPQASTAGPAPKPGAALRLRHVIMVVPGSLIGVGPFIGGSATGYLSPTGQRAIEGRQ